MKGLIIKQPYIDNILSGRKTWEIRGGNTKTRGKIELIQSGSGLVVGCCEIVDCLPLDKDSFVANKEKHLIQSEVLPYNKTFAWVIENAKRYDKPRKYKHPCGAIIWVNLS
jgi:hypothetical protein